MIHERGRRQGGRQYGIRISDSQLPDFSMGGKMKKLSIIAVMAALVVAMVASGAFAGRGNELPSGPHYNLNIIGVPKDKTADMDRSHGRRIFVPLDRKAKIWLQEGDRYQVLDANGTDGNGAKFQLPDPDPDDNLVLAYSVFARALGTPGGQVTITTCGYDQYGTEYCSTESRLMVRDKGKPVTVNVTKDLLTVYVDLGLGAGLKRYALFDDALQNYFWDYDNRGCKLVQLRFYEIPFDAN